MIFLTGFARLMMLTVRFGPPNALLVASFDGAARSLNRRTTPQAYDLKF